MASTYIETEAMASWKTEMDKINKDCVDNIDNIVKTMNTLNTSFQGNYADKYEQVFGQYSNKVKSSHESMRNLETFLDNIVEVMKNQ